MDGPDAAERVRTAVADCLARYDALRDDRQHDGPPLVAMRLYSSIGQSIPPPRTSMRPTTAG